jgi:hypothetical protein
MCSSRRFLVQCAVTYSTRPFLRLPLAYALGFGALVTLLVLSSGPAYAEWMAIGSSEGAGGTTVYVDPDTIQRKGDLVKMWALFDFKTIQNGEDFSYLSYRMQKRFDCARKRSQPRAAAYYSENMENGSVVFHKTGEGEWQPIAPGSVGHVLWDLGCSE